MRQIKAKIKYLLSFFKRNWTFEDYPHETWINPNAEQEDVKFGAKFTNWSTFVAHGNSVTEAIENLRNNLLEYGKGNRLPRPGSKDPIQFEDSVRIEKYERIAVDFFDKIIGINYYDCFISDMSSLFDFDLDNEEIMRKIKEEYGVEPSGDLILADIFEQINNASA